MLSIDLNKVLYFSINKNYFMILSSFYVSMVCKSFAELWLFTNQYLFKSLFARTRLGGCETDKIYEWIHEWITSISTELVLRCLCQDFWHPQSNIIFLYQAHIFYSIFIIRLDKKVYTLSLIIHQNNIPPSHKCFYTPYLYAK